MMRKAAIKIADNGNVPVLGPKGDNILCHHDVRPGLQDSATGKHECDLIIQSPSAEIDRALRSVEELDPLLFDFGIWVVFRTIDRRMMIHDLIDHDFLPKGKNVRSARTRRRNIKPRCVTAWGGPAAPAIVNLGGIHQVTGAAKQKQAIAILNRKTKRLSCDDEKIAGSKAV